VHADLLAKSAAQGLPLPSEVFFETIKAPSVELMERAVLAISPVHSEDWRAEIISFLQGNCLSDDEVYNKRMEARTRPYIIIEGKLYKHGVCSPLLVGAKAKTPPFARCLRRPRCTNGDKTTGRLTLRPTRRRTKTYDEVVSSCDLVQHGGPRVIRPIVTGPAWPLRITGLICKGLPVITVCKPALWEYSGDNLGAWGHMRP
jgi:hypothetical protein